MKRRTFLISFVFTFCFLPAVLFAQNGVYRELYTNITGTTVSTLTSAPAYPNSPASSNLVTGLFEAPSNVANNYGQRLRAFIIPPVSGNYTFWIASDDSSQLFLGTSEDSATRAQIASVGSAVVQRAFTQQASQRSAPIFLEGCRRYYIEALMKEGTGSDHLAVRWQLPDGTIEEPIPDTRLFAFTGTTTNAPVLVTEPTDATGDERSTNTFFCVIANNSAPLSYQWQKNGANISGATSSRYRLPSVLLTDQGATFRCIITNSFGSITSAVATLSVVADTTRPTVVRAANISSNRVFVTFSEPVENATAASSSNYQLNNGASVTSATVFDSQTVLLTTSALQMGSTYTVTINNVRDTAATPNTILAGSTIPFTASLAHDIGSGPQTGSSVLTNGGLQMTSIGSRVGGGHDQLQFVDQLRSGDFDLQIRVHSLSLGDLWSRVGLMARETYATNSRFAGAFATPSVAGTFFQYRNTTGGNASTIGSLPNNASNTWIRLQRVGNQFTGYAGYDGQTWTSLGSISFTAPSQMIVGIALASQSSAQSVTASVDSFATTASTTVAPFTPVSEPIGPSSRRTALVISEIMYHPADRLDGRNLEFVEIVNSHFTDEDIGGYRLTGEIDFTFPVGTVLRAGANIVVAAVPADVQALYGIGNVVGPFLGSLNNSGGRVRLRHRNGAILLETDYATSDPWPIAADGAGHSLVLARPSFGEADPRAWAASDRVGGSPGRLEPIVSTVPRGAVINEFLAHTDLPDLDYIEIYNRSTRPFSLDGVVITDDLGTNKYVFGAGTTLAPGAFIARTETQLGFRLDAAGETLYLKNADGSVVLDAVKFDAQENGIATGRVPNGADNFQRLRAPSLGTSNPGPLLSQVVISEIMYNPLSGLEDDEYIELYNRGSATNLGGWKLKGGIEFSFRTNSVISANGYFVIAKNMARLLTNYSQLNSNNTAGNYSGSLANSGERVSLTAPDTIAVTNAGGVVVTNRINFVVNEVHYRDGGRWGEWADGGGSSLELVDTDSDNRLAANWADSVESGKSVWATVQHTGLLDHGQGTIDELHALLLGGGEALVDDLEVFSTGGNLVPNPSFEGGFGSWIAQGNHVRSGLGTDGFLSTRSLHLRATSGGDNGANRVETDLTAAMNAGETATIRAKARWLRGQPDLLLRLHGNHLELSAPLPVPINLGTPGQQNSAYRANAGPAIHSVSHSPVLPSATESVAVTATAHDPDGVTSLTLRYRIDPSMTWVNATMSDSGASGDKVAGDGIFTATIPAQPSGTTVAFYVDALDGALVSARFPADAPTRECLVRYGEITSPGSIGTYRLWVNATNVSRWVAREKLSNEPLDSTFVYGNSRAVYNAGARYRGSPFIRPGYSSPTSGAIAYVFVMPKDDLILGADELNLDSLEPSKDETSQRERASFWIASRLGIPFSNERHINLIVNGVHNRNRGVPVYSDSQQPDKDYVSSWFPDDDAGDIFKIDDWFEFNDSVGREFNVDASLQNFVTTGGAKKQARYRWSWEKKSNGKLDDDYSSLFNLVDTVTAPRGTPQFSAAVESVIDVDEWARAFAVRHIVGDWDGYGYNRGKNMFSYKPEQGRWQMMLWDMDFALGDGDGTTTSLFNYRTGDTGLDNLYNTPVFRRAYWRAYQEAVDGPLRSEQIDPLLDQTYSAFLEHGISPTGPTVIKTYVSGRRSYIQSQLATVASPFQIEINGGNNFSSANNLVTLTGTAPVQVDSLEINGVRYAIVWTTITNWTVKVPVNAGGNSLQITGLDRFGNVIPGMSDSIVVTYTGAAADPASNLVINEIMYHPLVADTEFIEINNRSGTFTFDLSNYRLNGVDFIFPEGTIIAPGAYAVVVQNPAAFTNLYGATLPVIGEFSGSLDNGGETLQLFRPGPTAGQEILVDEVTYDDLLPWPMVADGTGPSLQLIDSAEENHRTGNWGVAGSNPLATPGLANSITRDLAPFPSLWLNEVQPQNTSGIIDNFGEREPWVELYNAGTVAVDLGGYFLANTFSNLTQWTFPAISIAPGQFLVIWADGEPTETAGNQLHTSFRLNATAGSLALSRPGNAGPEVIDYLNYQEVGAGRSYGSYPDAQGRLLQVFHVATPGATNNNASDPITIVINEWMAANTIASGFSDPADGHFEDWIELFNYGTNEVDLSNYRITDNLTNSGWTIPFGTRLAPKSYLLIWADDEVAQNGGSDLHAAFRLGQGGEAIGLFAPDGRVIDSVVFDDQSDNVSEGRFPDADANRVFFTQPTPRRSNRFPGTNTVPVLEPISDAMVRVGELFSYQAIVTDPDVPVQTLTWSLVGTIPAGASLSQSGLLTWRPGTNQVGFFRFTLNVSDNAAPPGVASESFLLTVIGPVAINSITLNSAGSPLLAFETIAGRSYLVEFSDQLVPAHWQPLSGLIIGNGAFLVMEDTTPNVGQRFYRVVQLD